MYVSITFVVNHVYPRRPGGRDQTAVNQSHKRRGFTACVMDSPLAKVEAVATELPVSSATHRRRPLDLRIPVARFKKSNNIGRATSEITTIGYSRCIRYVAAHPVHFIENQQVSA